MNYFALQVAARKEKSFIERAKKAIADNENYQFIFFEREMKIRRQGKTLVEKQPLFSGYVFIETEDQISTEVYKSIKKIDTFYRFLKSNHDITPLANRDLEILKHFMKSGSSIGSSKVYFDDNDRIVVEEGALKGLEGSIIKVDKRKRRAKIKLNFENSPMILDLSFDIIAKTEKQEQEQKQDEQTV